MTQVARPARSDAPSDSRGLVARINLGRLFTPPSTEFVLILSSVVLLTIFGLVMVTSATSARPNGFFGIAFKQMLFAAVGIPLMLIISRLPLRFLKAIAWPALIAATVVQLLVFSPLGVENDGNRNWISIAGFTLQPSEFLKLALAIWIAFVLLRKRTRLAIWHHVFIPVVPVSVLVIATVIAGHDLGTTMVIVLVMLGCLFFSGVKLRLFIIPVILGALGVLAFALTSQNRLGRITAGCAEVTVANYQGPCFQTFHGMWGMASGGIFGLGLGNSREKYGWLAAAENDFIFAIVGEELGLIGCLVVLALLVTLAVGIFRLMRKSDDPFVRVLAGGIVTWFMGQALVNIGVVVGLFPVLGVPLPFMSQGGTALLAALMAAGVVLACARTVPAPRLAKVAR